MTNVYTHEGLAADIEDNEAVIIFVEDRRVCEMSVKELLAMADAVRANMEEVE